MSSEDEAEIGAMTDQNALREALARIRDDAPDSGWDGWAEVDRLRDIAAVALDATPAPALDVERLKRALDSSGMGFIDGHWPSTWADDIAAEYARLAEKHHP